MQPRLKLYFTRAVLDRIQSDIAAHPPERGGALLGPIGQPVITDFLLDTQAHTTGASYLPSPQLTEQVQSLEVQQNLEFKGVIHSHPGGLDRPSGPDEEGIAEGLRINPHIPYFVAPIITRGTSCSATTRKTSWSEPLAAVLKAHELALGSAGKLSCYAGFRSAYRGIQVEPVAVELLASASQRQPTLPPTELTPHPDAHTPSPPENRVGSPQTHYLERDLAPLQRELGLTTAPRLFTSEIDGIPMKTLQLQLPGQLELILFVGVDYPVTPPIVLATLAGQNTEQVPVPWLLETPARSRLLRAIQSLFDPSGPYVRERSWLGKSVSAVADHPEARSAVPSAVSSCGADPALVASEPHSYHISPEASAHDATSDHPGPDSPPTYPTQHPTTTTEQSV